MSACQYLSNNLSFSLYESDTHIIKNHLSISDFFYNSSALFGLQQFYSFHHKALFWFTSYYSSVLYLLYLGYEYFPSSYIYPATYSMDITYQNPTNNFYQTATLIHVLHPSRLKLSFCVLIHFYFDLLFFKKNHWYGVNKRGRQRKTRRFKRINNQQKILSEDAPRNTDEDMIEFMLTSSPPHPNSCDVPFTYYP